MTAKILGALVLSVVVGIHAGCGEDSSEPVGGADSFALAGFGDDGGREDAGEVQAPAPDRNPQPVQPAAAPRRAPVAGVLHLKKLDVYDPGTSATAFGILVPSGWKKKGGVVWNLKEAQLAYMQIKFYNPAGSEQVEFFKNKAFYWQPPGTWIYQFRTGSHYLGCEVQPATTDPRAFVEKFFLPRERRGVGARVTATEDLPKIAKAAGKSLPGGLSPTIRAGRVRLEYRLDGKEMQEDVYVTLAATRSPYNRNVIFWGPTMLYSFRAEKGKLDAQTPLFNAMVSSSVIYLKWKAGYEYVQRLWTQGQMQAIANAGHISRIIAQNGEEIRQMYSRSYERRQRTYDRIYRNYSNYIRGVSDYKDPHSGDVVTMPSGYDHVWINRLGEYHLSNNPNYNPNLHGNQSWSQARPVR
jgi:hypothetical protein